MLGGGELVTDVAAVSNVHVLRVHVLLHHVLPGVGVAALGAGPHLGGRVHAQLAADEAVGQLAVSARIYHR